MDYSVDNLIYIIFDKMRIIPVFYAVLHLTVNRLSTLSTLSTGTMWIFFLIILSAYPHVESRFSTKQLIISGAKAARADMPEADSIARMIPNPFKTEISGCHPLYYSV